MKIKDIYESTTAGAIATVATPMTTQSRNASIYGGKKGGNLLTGKKTNKKYANSVNESKMKQVASDLETMQDGNFKQKYGKTKEQIKFLLGDPHAKKTVHEADLQEDDLILVPGQGHKLKSGFIPHGESRLDHEVEMARSDLFSAAKNAKQVYELIADLTEEEGLEGWVQEKIIKANDYLNTIREYLEGKELQQNEMGVIAGGAGNFEEGIGDTLKQVGKGISDRIKPMTKKSHEEKWYLSGYTLSEKPLGAGMGRANYFTTNNEFPSKKEALEYIKEKQANLNSYGKVGYFSLFVKSSERYFTGEPLFSKIEDPNKEEKVDEEGKGLWANIHAKRERIKKGSGERMRKPGSKGAPSSQDFKDAAKEGVGEKIKGIVRREKAKDLPLVQTRRDYAMGKAGQSYEKGETRKGNQYSAWAEKDRKKAGDPSTNPAGTYRTKTSDYSKGNK